MATSISDEAAPADSWLKADLAGIPQKDLWQTVEWKDVVIAIVMASARVILMVKSDRVVDWSLKVRHCTSNENHEAAFTSSQT